MALQLVFVLVALIIGARLGGIGLGVMGGIGPVSYTHLFARKDIGKACQLYEQAIYFDSNYKDA